MRQLDPTLMKNEKHRQWATEINGWIDHKVSVIRVYPELFDWIREQLGHPAHVKEFTYRDVPIIKIQRKK